MVHRIAPPPEIEGLTWVRALGSGGFADVHLYRQFLPARDVAVKVVRDPTESGSVDEMHREAELASVAFQDLRSLHEQMRALDYRRRRSSRFFEWRGELYRRGDSDDRRSG